MFVKICGVREAEHVKAAVDAGADAVGFLFTESPRRISAQHARNLTTLIPDHVLSVGVFAGEPPSQIQEVATESNVTAIQLHGSYEQKDFDQLTSGSLAVIRAVSGDSGAPVTCGAWGEDMLILDSSSPGAGHTWEWGSMPQQPRGNWLLAGGLRPDTVASAIASVRPWGVDVSSGVEVARGVKDSDLITTFVATAKGA